jgi:hypothetical protein
MSFPALTPITAVMAIVSGVLLVWYFFGEGRAVLAEIRIPSTGHRRPHPVQ